MIWAVVPAAGSGQRFGGELPKQYRSLAGRPVIAHALGALLTHPQVEGVVVVLAADDPHWPGVGAIGPKPVLTCIGGADRAASVLAGLQALPPDAGDAAPVLVHDAARPNLHGRDLDRLLAAGHDHPDGAILAAPVRDTLKCADGDGLIASTQPRERLWRALTPQLFPRRALQHALQAARADGAAVTDEAMAMERIGARPRLVEGAEDNIKITTPADLAYVEWLLQQREGC